MLAVVLGALAVLLVGGGALAFVGLGYGNNLLGGSGQNPSPPRDNQEVVPSQPEITQEPDASEQDSEKEQSGQQESPSPENTSPEETPAGEGAEENTLKVPELKTLYLMIPKVEKAQNVTVPNVQADDLDMDDSDNELANNVAVHFDETGFPWQEETNVYLVGHSIGYEGTNSFGAFYDLPDLKNGDHIYVTDAYDRRYTYEVFRDFNVKPTNLSVLETVEGKNILTIQTYVPKNSTPNSEGYLEYIDLLYIVQAELTDITTAETTTSSGPPESTASTTSESTTSDSYRPTPYEAQADAQEAAGDYYRAAGVEDWDYTYENLDAETQSHFTREEWFQKNQWFADNGSVTYDVLSGDAILRPGTTGPVVKISLRLTYEDGSSSTRDTYFIYENGSYKHGFGEEENDLFMPDLSYEEFVQAQQ